jgi:hypothetical protein
LGSDLYGRNIDGGCVAAGFDDSTVNEFGVYGFHPSELKMERAIGPKNNGPIVGRGCSLGHVEEVARMLKPWYKHIIMMCTRTRVSQIEQAGECRFVHRRLPAEEPVPDPTALEIPSLGDLLRSGRDPILRLLAWYNTWE